MTRPRFFLNPAARSNAVGSGLFDPDEYDRVHTFFHSRPALAPTPLRRLPALAARLGLGDLWVKDESLRFGLNAFKIVGVTYAIDRLLGDKRIAARGRLVSATSGNHGRAVARVARERGLDEEIPRWIMAGYTRLLDEAATAWAPEAPPDIVLAQAGVGGLLCAVVSWLCHRYGARRPFVIACEPTEAACVLESARAGTRVTLGGSLPTMMAGLRCGEVSPLAWSTIAATVDAFVAIDDERAAMAMRALAHPTAPDPPVVAGPSGACGIGALFAMIEDDGLRPLREASGLGIGARVLAFNTEGATEPDLYARIAGDRSPADVG